MKKYSRKIFSERCIAQDYVNALFNEIAYIKVFVNPSISELNTCKGQARGVIDRQSGNLYVAQSEDSDGNWVIHKGLIEFLVKENYLKMSLSDALRGYDHVLCVQQYKHEPVFAVGELTGNIFYKDPKLLDSYLMKVKRKNPHLTFVRESILEMK